MAKIEITKTELVWPGKYNEDGTLKEVPRVSLPFQVIERVNESRATREARKGQTLSLFDVYEGKEGDTFEEGWRNKLIWGDNLLVMGSLLDKFAGKIDLIYIDPPFATGADFSFTTEIGESGEEVLKEQSIIEEKAYRDTWGAGNVSYLAMMSSRMQLMFDLLSPGGSFVVHCDWHVAHLLRALLDEIFGADSFNNEIVWRYRRWPAKTRVFQRMHDTLLWYAKPGKEHAFTQLYEELAASTLETWGTKRQVADFSSGRRKPSQTDEETKGAPMADVWDIGIIAPIAHERVGYATQKPEALLDRVVTVMSNPGDLVADFFCGSGTTLAVAEKLGRRWIGCDLGRWAIHVTRKRLLGIENCKPFEVLNLGKYERQYWQGVTFGDKRDKSVTERALYEYLAFILKLYGAEPVAGMAHLHGKKGKAMVHIGAVDAPVTIDEVNQALDECVALKQTELHVLGWEWEMGLAGPNNEVRKGSPMHEIARQKGVKLLLLQIPREVMEEQAVEKGDVRFFELAYFEAKISMPKKLTVQLELTDFATPNADLIPEDVRSKVKKWSDYIDYWAIDWNFQNDTFMQGWVAYRTRKERKLPLVSDTHTYEKPGRYRILVKVIDIFGNDTSQAFDVDLPAPSEARQAGVK
jgi:DNA modification methylase